MNLSWTWGQVVSLVIQEAEARRFGIRWEPRDDGKHLLAPDYWSCRCSAMYIHQIGTMPTRPSLPPSYLLFGEHDVVEFCPRCNAEEPTCLVSSLREVLYLIFQSRLLARWDTWGSGAGSVAFCIALIV